MTLQEPARVYPCFMTGKACAYADLIGREIRRRHQEQRLAAFAIMPFRPNLQTFFQHRLAPLLGQKYRFSVECGDLAGPPGLVVCDGVCKRIQSVDLVTADISIPNANVFYELGLACGIGQNVLLLYHEDSEFGRTAGAYFLRGGAKPYPYSMDTKRLTDDLPTYVWQLERRSSPSATSVPRMLYYEQLRERTASPPDAQNDDIVLDVKTHVAVAVELALDDVCRDLKEEPCEHSVVQSHLPSIKEMRHIQTVNTEASFAQICRDIDDSYCMIIRTGESHCHPMSYFWLGYCHGRGKNVIPISVVDKPGEPIQDYAFDMRAWLYMTLVKQNPGFLKQQLQETLRRMILTDFAHWSRKQFWDVVCAGRGSVHIFTGSLHSPGFGREMVGDWDLRAASELTAYFARRQILTVIEAPVYCPEYVARPTACFSKADYVAQLRGMLTGKTCVIVGSPDINPLAELALGAMYGTGDEMLFEANQPGNTPANAVIMLKQRPGLPSDGAAAARLFYTEQSDTSGRPTRGFCVGQASQPLVVARFLGEDEVDETFHVYAHLAVIANPFGSDSRSHYIVLLNGVSGPATFALAQLLTGAAGGELLSYRQGFNPETEAESILDRMLHSDALGKLGPVQCIVDVTVGTASSGDKLGDAKAFDSRRILEWHLAERDGHPLVFATNDPPWK